MSNWSHIARRVRVPMGFVTAALYIWLARPTGPSISMGAAVALLGVGLRALASGHITKNSALTTTGPYAATRNPLYLGSIIIAIGFAIAARSLWVPAVLAALFLVIYLPVIRSEEAFLRSAFIEFDDYSRRVPRFLPRLAALPRVAEGFSSERYWRHREYNAFLGTAAMLAVLIVKLLVLRD
ncbi:MAG TPA: isoprenylcysteine carboxylmethyltransferase family protein [Terriglobales bacterium]|nr:isoprenylcysteine carboxylmethyltransferase family protein [Terriglobales bacterium]